MKTQKLPSWTIPNSEKKIPNAEDLFPNTKEENSEISANPPYFVQDGYIIESATGLRVYKIGSVPYRKQMLKHLNQGGGFAGNTPAFVARNPIVKAQP